MPRIQFNKKAEFEDAGYCKPIPYAYGMGEYKIKKYNTPITPRENFLRMMNREPIEWIPNMMGDFNFIQPFVMDDAVARAQGGLDWFGIEWEYEPKSKAAMVKPGTRRLSDIGNWREELVFPDLNGVQWQKDYEENYEAGIDPDKMTCFVIENGCFERLADLTSFEDAFCYLLEEEEELAAFFERLTDFHIELIKIAKEIYHADLITFHDDMGSQKSSFMSPETFRKIMMPHYVRMNQAAHDMGLYVIYHSCGNVGNLLDDFCKCGFDIWEGQDNCNDTMTLLAEYGDRIVFENVFKAPADMDDESYYQEIERRIKEYAPTGRVMMWLCDQNPEHDKRSFNDDDAIYCISREICSKL